MKSRGITMTLGLGLGLAATAALLAGCSSIGEAQQISSGFTGCEPADNVISLNQEGPGWHAVCKGKTYVCTDVSTSLHSATFSCAAAAQ